MKTIKSTILFLLLSLTGIAQEKAKLVFGLGIDPKMAIYGAHIERPSNSPSLDIEASLGVERETFRYLMQVKSHKAVNFFKWTYIQIDYKKEVLSNLYVYGGLEMSAIRKTHPDAHYTSINNYRRVTVNPLTPGANLEIQYKVGVLGFALQGSIYQAEDELRGYKPIRTDVTAIIYVNL